jgi:CBS domain containing-hemolysin-like protein
MRQGRRSAELLHQHLENPEDFLWTILVGNTLANFWILGWLVVELHALLQGHPVWFIAVYLVSALLFYTLFDLLPKLLFRMFPNRLCLLLARPVGLVHLALRPLVALVKGVSELLLRWRGGKVFTGHLFGNREELRLLMQESSHTLTSEERAMINRVLDLQSLTVRQAMRPLAEAVTVDANDPVSQLLAHCRERNLSRLPVWDNRDDQRQIIGVANLHAVLYQPDLDATHPVRGHVQPALYLEEDLRLELALRRMQRSGQRLAIVLARDRQASGIITLQDVLKVIFGEVSL